MNPQEIKALIEVMAASDLAEMELSRDGSTLRLVRAGGSTAPRQSTAVAAPVAASAPPPAEPVAPAPTPAAEPAMALTAPLYGVVHWSPAPGEAPFVAPGLGIQPGQVVCVIEAMKVFNEVRAERAATVVALLVESGQEVEAGQPLLRLA